MLEILQISENGLRANQTWLNSISHNVANIQTAGFKKSLVSFGELINNPASLPSGDTKFEGMGTKINSQIINIEQGDIKTTNRALDLAIEGTGFFEVEIDDSTLGYTRVGRLTVNPEGKLTTQEGYPIASDVLIPIDAKNIKIAPDGSIHADVGQDQTLELGKIQIMNFANPEHLKPIGNEMYITTPLSGEPDNSAEANTNKILQGFIEMSNVDLIDEMTNLLLAQRAYQLNARLIQTADQILETINNLRR